MRGGDRTPERVDCIEWPDDELSVFATLHSPFFALSDEALLLFRQGVEENSAVRIRRLDPMRPLDRSTIPPAAVDVAAALDCLRELHIGRNRRPIAQTITMLLDAVRAHAGIALWPTGEQALANVQRLIDIVGSSAAPLRSEPSSINSKGVRSAATLMKRPLSRKAPKAFAS